MSPLFTRVCSSGLIVSCMFSFSGCSYGAIGPQGQGFRQSFGGSRIKKLLASESALQGGRTMFEGIFVGIGPVSALLPEIWSADVQQALGRPYTTAQNQQLLNASHAFEDQLEAASPNFLESLNSEMTSGDPIRVDAMFTQAQGVIYTALQPIVNSPSFQQATASAKKRALTRKSSHQSAICNFCITRNPTLAPPVGLPDTDSQVDSYFDTDYFFQFISDFQIDQVLEFEIGLFLFIIFIYFIPVIASNPASATAPAQTESYPHDELIALMTQQLASN